MKVLLDTNVYISYLLAGSSSRAVVAIVESCLIDPDIELIVPAELLDELHQSLEIKTVAAAGASPESGATSFLVGRKDLFDSEQVTQVADLAGHKVALNLRGSPLGVSFG